MKKLLHLLLLLLLALSVTLTAPVALAQPGPPGDDGPPGHDDGPGDDEGEEEDEGEDEEDEGEDEGEDDDGPPGLAGSLIKFDQRTFSVLESVGEAVISVERSKGEDGAVTVEYATSDGSAVDGEDYTGVSGSLTWDDGDDERKTFLLPILEDDEFEVRETVHLELTVVSGDAQLHPGKGRAVVQILDASEDNPGLGDDDDGPGEVEIRNDEPQAIEGEGPLQVVVVRDDGSEGSVSVAYATADGSATAGEDYEAVSGVLSWGDGEKGPRTVDVPILEDDLEEGNETFTLTLSDPTGGLVIDDDDGVADATILDNDGEVALCVEDDETLCLADDRFQVQVDWRTPQGDSGTGTVEELSDNSGLVWFFDPDNYEMLVKVLDACSTFDKYWVFFAATTNVDFTVTVTDTDTGVVKEYTNPAGQAAEPVQDTFTFEGCN